MKKALFIFLFIVTYLNGHTQTPDRAPAVLPIEPGTSEEHPDGTVHPAGENTTPEGDNGSDHTSPDNGNDSKPDTDRGTGGGNDSEKGDGGGGPEFLIYDHRKEL
ncbi:MAG: hypothetical protein U0T73_04660 [Chitinophagales bacterium]